MNLTPLQEEALAHLRAAYVGPEEGPHETTLNPPHRQYVVGMLFPIELGRDEPSSVAAAGIDDQTVSADVEQGDVEESGADVPLAEDWRPSSVAVSFVIDTPSVVVDFECGTYAQVNDEGPKRWTRTPHTLTGLALSRDEPPLAKTVGGVPIQIGTRWRAYGEQWLVTVHVRVTAKSTGDEREDISLMLFQVALAVRVPLGSRFLEYDKTHRFDSDPEAAEIRLRYRNCKVYAVGHGMASDWDVEDDTCTRVWLSPVPSFVVPAVETTTFEQGAPESKALDLLTLASIEQDPEEVLQALEAFVNAFDAWVRRQRDRVPDFGEDVEVADRIVRRSELSVQRMADGVQALRDQRVPHIRRAFALGMTAMELQMQQGSWLSSQKSRSAWRPFQLGFLLIALASTLDPRHDDRELVDLIWFPTGGGKTEAYLGLAAIEIFRRRLAHGPEGGGTAVITRYTLRLLTSQQFQRAAALICAMELMRRDDPRVRGMSPFSIGLWVGNEVTPGSHKDALGSLQRLLKAKRPEEAFGFQVESCPWCQTPSLPGQQGRANEYGVKREGNRVVAHCVDPGCPFFEDLPLQVVDEGLYEEPPTILLATVDKFARLQFEPRAGRLLGLGTAFLQPSLIIQDELHLLSGPLGTTVAVFDAVLQVLLESAGHRPKIVASTATIRAAAEQVNSLYGRTVDLYPPAGLDDDQTFFSVPASTGEGRLYTGLMPQSLPQTTAVVSATTPLLELAEVSRSGAPKDAYWTVVMYHNSLRELGRSNTLVADDVDARLETRASRLGINYRPISASRVLELTSRRRAEELPRDLKALQRRVEQSTDAVDVVLSSNMLSVGIDIPRLAVMLMVGQPKTTSEYIQSTSRVGRGSVRGLIVTLFRSNRARDRSHFETFRASHEALYRSVEPTSVTPWSLASRDRSLAGALIALVRQAVPALAPNEAAGELDPSVPSIDAAVSALVSRFLDVVERADGFERAETEEQLRLLRGEWQVRAERARQAGERLSYEKRGATPGEVLVRRFGEPGSEWLVGDSMRSVDPNVTIEVREPFEEVSRG
ncbi:helicase-related protein [Mobilicoccus sp.]|uniref:helicase-related protein n=1 Tax=Mobilicoccus sp. TaxID=2034349 RepID=UPI0028A70988|nr:helicase-related protein [Mobilicoccus sp.]